MKSAIQINKMSYRLKYLGQNISSTKSEKKKRVSTMITMNDCLK